MPRSKQPNLYGVILAGGRGTRFWPRSRRKFPKQLMNLGGSSSLLQQSVARLQPLIPPERVWVFTTEVLVAPIRRQLPQVPRDQIVAEPVQRNTAPCIGLAAELISRTDPDAVLGVFPSDQQIGQLPAFRKAVRLAARHAAEGAIVVFGIAPRWPETGYGYIEFATRPAHRNDRALPVRQFREKPARKVAEQYVASRRFFWNSGMFFWRAATVQQALREYLPKTAGVLAEIASGALRPGAPLPARFSSQLKKLYSRCENISVDYAVLEKAQRVLGIPCEFGWSDLGSWNAVYDLLPHDSEANVLRGETLLLDTSGVLIDVPGKLVAGIGLRDLVIVETPDALLVARRDRAQEVSQLVKKLEENRKEKLL